MSAKSKTLRRLRRRDKRVKRHNRVIERYHKERVKLAYWLWYTNAEY